MGVVNDVQGIYSDAAWEPITTTSLHFGSLQYSVNYHLIVLNEFHPWGQTAIGLDNCRLFGEHPTMNRAPFDVAGSPQYTIVIIMQDTGTRVKIIGLFIVVVGLGVLI